MKRAFLMLPIALGLGLVGCDEPGFVSAGFTTQRTAYYDDGGADFYYVDRTPYSRSYGPLVSRNDRYYYRNGGGLVIYNKPTRRWRDSDRKVREYRTDRRENVRDRRDDGRDDVRDSRDNDRDDRRDEYRNDRRFDPRPRFN